MSQEEKELLLKDLCGRLPYTPILNILGVAGYDEKLIAINRAFEHSKYAIVTNSFEEPHYPHEFDIEEIRPYLRPMESMSIEELNECATASGISDIPCPNWKNDEPTERLKHSSNVFKCDSRQVEWLNAHHFDYRGLIPMGLALEAPEGMYNI